MVLLDPSIAPHSSIDVIKKLPTKHILVQKFKVSETGDDAARRMANTCVVLEATSVDGKDASEPSHK